MKYRLKKGSNPETLECSAIEDKAREILVSEHKEIVSLIHEKKLSFYRLSKITGVKEATISAYYKDKFYNITVKNRALLLAALRSN